MFQKITYKLFEWRCLILDSHRRRPGNKDFCKQVVNLRGDFLKLWQGNGIRRGEETNQLCTNNWNLTLLRIVSACVKHTLTSHPTQGVRDLMCLYMDHQRSMAEEDLREYSWQGMGTWVEWTLITRANPQKKGAVVRSWFSCLHTLTWCLHGKRTRISGSGRQGCGIGVKKPLKQKCCHLNQEINILGSKVTWNFMNRNV